ncbi:pteridine reductase [Marinihelvus fidelis]|uniref:Pteridine reductase n=1 Tax=Marinihelvus fidelis TaxID=2613842 RepID=A0A5N0TBV3_9GAMM|nr:pteridine reductase [Marinihelvus fidelis]KAA9131306.1 pteridine reductase [Marinihelvus fidelis]
MSDAAKSSDEFALITGGARRIGRAIVQALHRRGLRVIIHCRSSVDEANTLARELNDRRPGSAFVTVADLEHRDGPDQLARSVMAITPELALLVNNASRFHPTPVGETEYDDWRALMGSNARGPFFLTQALAPSLAGGAIVNLLDIHGRRPMRRHTVYGMAKAALEMMTLSLARELAPDIRVNGVAPGAILWPEGEADPDTAAKNQAAILERVPMGRTGTPEDIAGAVAWLGLDAPYVTGQVLAVDGGRSLYG